MPLSREAAAFGSKTPPCIPKLLCHRLTVRDNGNVEEVFMLLDSNVRIFRDGTISFSRELCAKSGLREGTTLSVFYSRPGNFLFLKPLGENAGGVPVSRSDRGAMVAGQ